MTKSELLEKRIYLSGLLDELISYEAEGFYYSVSDVAHEIAELANLIDKEYVTE